MELGGFAAAGGEGVQTGDSRVEFVEALADRIARPAQQLPGFPLAKAETVHRLGHEAAAASAAQGSGGVDQQCSHRIGEFHQCAAG
jgi:hypothetical protein